MTSSMPTSANPCQAVADPICSNLQFTYESGTEEQKSEAENGTQNLVSKEVSVRVRPPAFVGNQRVV
jgi:hypothetical protein